MTILNETYPMSHGVEIPKLGLGTWFIGDGKAAAAVRAAVEIGYRNIDTAQAYGNEHGVGEGVRTGQAGSARSGSPTSSSPTSRTFCRARPWSRT